MCSRRQWPRVGAKPNGWGSDAVAVRVPATSANMGPGFDALGVALTLHADVGLVGVDGTPADAREAEDSHPAQVAFVRAGGSGRVWVRSEIPIGRGLGFSGAVRIGGALVAEQQQNGSFVHRSPAALALCTELEGHADNVGPALCGGVVVTADGRVVSIPVAMRPAFVAWIPGTTTSTSESRRRIGPEVTLEAAVFNIARTAMLVAALATGDTAALREATRDAIHQDIRFAAAPGSLAAFEAGLAAGAWCGWLSGSGPTVTFMCAPDEADEFAMRLPADGHTKVLGIDGEGARTL